MRRFRRGETVVRRDVFRRRVWSAHAFLALQDGPDAVVVACRPGAELLAPSTWIEWLLTGNEAVRGQAVPDLARGDWCLGPWSWRGTAQVQWVPPGTWFGVHAFYGLSQGHGLTRWYVNFQRPMRRTALGFDTFDLLLDLVIAPDLARWDWKDEDEYAHGRRPGVVSEADHQAVERAREQAVAMIEERDGPFAASAEWLILPPGTDRPAPVLPPDVLTAGFTRSTGARHHTGAAAMTISSDD